MQRSGIPVEPFAGEAEIVVERLAHQGDGLAHVGGHRVHVPLAAPGDRLRIAYGGARGRILERLAEGPDRIVPPCPHFGACGGCALQHIAPEAYRRFKRDILLETLAQRGFADPPLEALTIIPERTRRRATFAFRIKDGAMALGFYRAGTRAVLDIEACLVLTPAIMSALPALRRGLAMQLGEDDSGRLHVTATQAGLDVDLSLSGAPLPPARIAALAGLAASLDLARLTLDGAPIALRRKPVISLGGFDVAPPPRAFLQPSLGGEAALTAWVQEGVGHAKRVIDLFSGLGTFALPLSRKAKIHAVDSDGALIDALTEASRHGTGAKPVTAETRDLLRNPVSAKALSRFDAVVFDPPRAGAKAQTEALARSGVARIVAVSCNAASFARDARGLADAGYHMEWVRPLDQFLWSAHIELVALFTRETKR